VRDGGEQSRRVRTTASRGCGRYGGATVAGALKDLAFAIGERVFVCAPGFGGESGIDGAKTGVDAADGFSNLGGGALFEEVAAGSGNDRARGAESRRRGV
jgi:hypothetical protein